MVTKDAIYGEALHRYETYENRIRGQVSTHHVASERR